MPNSADPDQLASEEANWSGSTLFAKAGYIRVQQDKGDYFKYHIYPNKSDWANLDDVRPNTLEPFYKTVHLSTSLSF